MYNRERILNQRVGVNHLSFINVLQKSYYSIKQVCRRGKQCVFWVECLQVFVFLLEKTLLLYSGSLHGCLGNSKSFSITFRYLWQKQNHCMPSQRTVLTMRRGTSLSRNYNTYSYSVVTNNGVAGVRFGYGGWWHTSFTTSSRCCPTSTCNVGVSITSSLIL